eukprot:scaffold8978_cov80-Phaeocystis_antarctica.AAC.2
MHPHDNVDSGSRVTTSPLPGRGPTASRMCSSGASTGTARSQSPRSHGSEPTCSSSAQTDAAPNRSQLPN